MIDSGLLGESRKLAPGNAKRRNSDPGTTRRAGLCFAIDPIRQRSNRFSVSSDSERVQQSSFSGSLHSSLSAYRVRITEMPSPVPIPVGVSRVWVIRAFVVAEHPTTSTASAQKPTAIDAGNLGLMAASWSRRHDPRVPVTRSSPDGNCGLLDHLIRSHQQGLRDREA